MKINNIGYLIKEGIRGIFLHGFMSFAAVFVTVASLLILGTVTAVTHNLSLIVEEQNSEVEVLVYINDAYKLEKAKQVETNVRKIDNIKQTTFVTREEAFEEFRENFKDPSLLEGVTPDALEHRVRIQLIDNTKMDDTMERLGMIPGVTEVKTEGGLVKGFTDLQEVLRVISLVLVVILLFVSLLIISNTVKMAMADRKNEIAIMKMVGATNGFIRLPFVVQGFTLGMIGAGLAFGLEWLLYDAMAGKLNAYSTLDFLSFVPFTTLLPLMVPVFAAAGMFVGVVGSWNSIRKYMKV